MTDRRRVVVCGMVSTYDSDVFVMNVISPGHANVGTLLRDVGEIAEGA